MYNNASTTSIQYDAFKSRVNLDPVKKAKVAMVSYIVNWLYFVSESGKWKEVAERLHVI